MAQRVPIRGEAGVGYVLDRDFDMPPLMLTADEIEAAVLGASLQALTAAAHPGPLPPHVLAEHCADRLGTWWRERHP